MRNCKSEVWSFGPARNDGGNDKKRPGFPGRFRVDQKQRLAETRTVLRGGFARRAVDHLRGPGAGGNRNVARLLGLGDFADEIDVEQARSRPKRSSPRR